MGIAKVTRNYQVTIPKDVREMKGIRIGDTLIFAIEGERIEVLKKRKEELIKEVAGIWKGKESGLEYVRKIRKESEKRRKRFGL